MQVHIWSLSVLSILLFTAPTLGLSHKCRSLLDTADPNDAFNTVGLACPFQTEGQFPDRACRNSLDEAPPDIKPTFLSEANRLPDFEFQDMVYGEFSKICGDIFASKEFTALVQRVPELGVAEVRKLQDMLYAGHSPAEEPSHVQRQMASVLSQLHWSYCHKISRGVNVVEHAFFKNDTQQIVLYASACIAKDIYQLGIDQLSLAHRFALISAHEVGHAIDQAAGGDLRRRTAEDFATLLGTFFAQCHGRLVSHFIRDAAEPDESGQKKAERLNLLARYSCYEEEIIEIREEVKGFIKAPRDLKKKTRSGGVFSCATFINDKED